MRAFRKCNLYCNRVTESKVMANEVKFWPILVDFTMTSHLLFSNHVTIVANFEKFLIPLGFLLNFRKVTKFQRVSSKALRVTEEKLRGVPKDSSGPNRVKLDWSQ